jgi:hypothetical protein
VRDNREDVEPFAQYGVDREEIHRKDELYLRSQKPLPGQGTPDLPSPPKTLKLFRIVFVLRDMSSFKSSP